MKKILLSFLIAVFSKQFSFGQGTWIQKASIPFTARWGTVGFSIGTKGYVGTGYNGSTYYGDFFEYNPSINSWTQIASVPVVRAVASAFVVGNKGYVCLGANLPSAPTLTDIWEYDPSNNTWVQKTSFPGSPRYGSAGFSIGNKGYIGCGNEGSATGPFTNEFWEFDPVSNSWTQKTNFPGNPRYGLTHMGWALGNKGYLGLGYDGSFYNDLYEYDPSNDTWTQKSNFPGTGRSYGVAFSTCYKYYAGTGQNSGIPMNDIWKYNPGNDTWAQMANFGGGNRWLMASFVIGSNGYCGTGYDFTNYYNDWWMYTCENVGVFEENITENLITFFPTILTDFAIIEINNNVNIHNAEMKIFDINGKEIRKESISKNLTKFYKGNLKQGIYLYAVSNDYKKIGYGKFIVN